MVRYFVPVPISRSIRLMVKSQFSPDAHDDDRQELRLLLDELRNLLLAAECLDLQGCTVGIHASQLGKDLSEINRQSPCVAHAVKNWIFTNAPLIDRPFLHRDERACYQFRQKAHALKEVKPTGGTDLQSIDQRDQCPHRTRFHA